MYKSEHLKLYNHIHIALDTFPYNGATTTCEALWMGTPVITLAGEIHAGRVGVSLMNNLGLSEWVAESTEEYVQRAAELSGNHDVLRQLHENLRTLLIRSALMDSKGFTRSLESEYKKMWRRWCDQ